MCRALFSLAAFLAASKPPVFLVEPMIQRGYLYTLTALTFHGKTTLMILLAICVATGRTFAGCHTGQGRVVYFAGENPDDVAQKFLVACDYWGLDPAQLPITIVPGAFDLAANMDDAIACAEADGAVRSALSTPRPPTASTRARTTTRRPSNGGNGSAIPPNAGQPGNHRRGASH